MIRLSTNLKYLRQKANFSQSELAEKLGIARTTLGDYERGKTEPSLEMLTKFSRLFEVDIDSFITLDLGDDSIDVTNSQDMRILAISVDSENNENIELVETKAEAGYMDGFQDPEYIKDLPKISFPNMPRGTYRGFEITGDSMLPIESGSIIIASYVERLEDLKDGNTYIIASQERGLVYKRVKKDFVNNKLLLISDNTQFKPYEVNLKEVTEVWKYYAHLSFSDGIQNYKNLIDNRIEDIHSKVTDLHDRLKQD